jgi:Raf kinase inhibitor-like YbhB/YbcL family protein
VTRGRTPLAVAVVAFIAATASACSGSTAKDTRALGSVDVPKKIVVTSTAFADGGPIPRANTCDGTGGPPTIRWTAVPAAAKSVAVVVDDPDAPGGAFLHWLVIGLPASKGNVPTNAAGVSELDNGAGTKGWTPPCPPPGAAHHYRFSVYALSDFVCADLGDASNGPGCSAPSSSQALPQIIGTAIAKGTLVGTYQR